MLENYCIRRLKTEAFEKWCFRRILNISWVKNLKVLRRIGKDKVIMRTIKIRKLRYFGHMMRGEKYKNLHLILEGKICGKRSKRRPNTNWLQNLRQWFDCNTNQIFKAAQDKIYRVWVISNLR